MSLTPPAFSPSRATAARRSASRRLRRRAPPSGITDSTAPGDTAHRGRSRSCRSYRRRRPGSIAGGEKSGQGPGFDGDGSQLSLGSNEGTAQDAFFLKLANDIFSAGLSAHSFPLGRTNLRDLLPTFRDHHALAGTHCLQDLFQVLPGVLDRISHSPTSRRSIAPKRAIRINSRV